MFITLEGIDGSGKSTLLPLIVERLRAGGRTVTTAREPGGTPVGDAVREIFLHPGLHPQPLSEALLINASRAALVAEVIRPALAAGGDVVCDRYTDSTLAYQGYGRGLDVAMLQAMCDAATQHVVPDVTLLLDLPVDAALARMTRRPGADDRMDTQSLGFYQRARDGYLALARANPRIRVLDATRSLDALLGEAMAAISQAAAA